MKPPFVRSAYNYDMNAAGEETAIRCKDPSLTQQSFAEEVDINTIVERFGLTGEIPTLKQLPHYADYEGIFDYQTAMNAIVAADREFMSLPAHIRTRFGNDPAQFLDFFAQESNRDEAIRLGFIKKLEPEQAQAPEKKGETPKNP